MKHGLLAELKRRHVYRVAVAYAVVGWLLIEVATQVFPFFRIPDWSERLIVFLVLAGFPIALMLAWAFELTPEGVRRTEPVDSPDARPPQQHHRVGRLLDFAIISVLALAVGALAWRLWRSHATPPAASTAASHTAATPREAATGKPATAPAQATTTAPRKSIAVLPFENLSADRTNDYFVAGMQDLVLTKLADIGELKVISRSSTLKYGSHPDDLKTIAGQLGVATVLEGSVQKSGNSVLINVQLIDAQTDAHLWAQAYTRTLDNVFGVEGEVAGKIASALQAKLSPAETKRLGTALTTDSQANDLFLRAEYFANRGRTSGDFTSDLNRAIGLYRQALARAPDFALALARLSRIESWLAFNGGGGEDVRKLSADARTRAERALQLAPELAEAHLAMGYNDDYGKADYDAALTSFDAALQIRPNDAAAYGARGYVLRHKGEFDQALDAFQKALAHDPRNSLAATDVGETLMATGRYVDAERALQHALALDPDNDAARVDYALSIAFRTDDLDRALLEVQGDNVRLLRIKVNLLAMQRNYRAALAVLEHIPETPGDVALFFSSRDVQVANLYRLSGDISRARAHFAKVLPALRTRLSALGDHPVAQAHVWNAIAVAELGLGKSDAGIAAVKASLAAGERSGDHYAGPAILLANAALYAEAGLADQAVPLLARALATPGIGSYYSPVLLWRGPAWDPIRKDPAFQALLKQYASYRPATAPDTATP